MKTSTRRSPLFAALMLLATMLAPLPAASAPAVTSPSPVTISQEIALGEKAAAEVRKEYGTWDNPTQAERVKRIAVKLFAVSDRHDVPLLARNFTVELLDTKTINAFCTPGGHTFVTRGLLELGVDDNELAGVMGHEIAHAARRHGARNIEANKFLQARVNQLTKHRTLQVLAQLPILLFTLKRFSPQLEHEADYYGAIYAFRAGYAPDGMARMMVRFKELESNVRSSRLKRLIVALTDNHPPTEERLRRCSEVGEKLKRGETVPTTEVPIYE